MASSLIVVVALATATPAASPRFTPQPAVELVTRIHDAPLAELQALSFFELNALKNAVFAATGYSFARDRPWLRYLLCQPHPATAAPASPLALAAFSFPECVPSQSFDDRQERAVTNLRVAVFKKIEALGTVQAVDQALVGEKRALEAASLRVIGFVPAAVRAGWYESTRREVHALRRVLEVGKHPAQIDPMELLGLYAGDIAFLRCALEARHGKHFDGTLAWELSQVFGMAEIDAAYDPARLPPEVQATLQVLDDVEQKVRNSDLNDLPDALRGSRQIDVQYVSYGAAC